MNTEPRYLNRLWRKLRPTAPQRLAIHCALFIGFIAPVNAAEPLLSAADFTQIVRGGFRHTMQPGAPYPQLSESILLSEDPLTKGNNSYSWSMAWYDADGPGDNNPASLYVGTVRNVLCAAGGGGTPLTEPCPVIANNALQFDQDWAAEIWRYDPSPYADYGGTNGDWTRVYQSPLNGFGSILFNNTPRDVGYRNQSVCRTHGDARERLYATTSGVPGNILYINDSGTSFAETSRSGLKTEFSEFLALSGEGDIGYRGLACLNGYLITSPASSIDSDSPDVSENPFLIANADPAQQDGSVSNAWVPLADFRNFPSLDFNRDGDFNDSNECAGCGLGSATGDPSNYGAFDMMVLDGDLWVAVSNRGSNGGPDRGGVELWRGDADNFGYMPNGSVMGDGSGIVWNKVIDAGAGRREDSIGVSVDNALGTFGSLDGKLYLAMWESGFAGGSKAELIRVDPGSGPGDETWELLIGGGRTDYATDPLLNGSGSATGTMVCNDTNRYVEASNTPSVTGPDCYPSTGRNVGFGSAQPTGTDQFNDDSPPAPLNEGGATYFWRMGSHIPAPGEEELYMGTYAAGESFLNGSSCGGSEADPCLPNTVDGGFELYKTSAAQAGNEWHTLNIRGFGNPLNYGVRSILSVQLPDAPVDEHVLFIGTANAYTNAPDIPGTAGYWGGTEVYMSGRFAPPASEGCDFFIIPDGNGSTMALCL